MAAIVIPLSSPPCVVNSDDHAAVIASLPPSPTNVQREDRKRTANDKITRGMDCSTKEAKQMPMRRGSEDPPPSHIVDSGGSIVVALPRQGWDRQYQKLKQN